MSAPTDRTPSMTAPPTTAAPVEKERVSTFLSITRVMLTGFTRDRTALFFTLAMPLIFLLLFGVLTKNAGTSHVKIAEVGQVTVLDSMPGDARTELAKSVTITKYDDESAALQKVKKGDLDGLVEQGPNGQVVLRFSAADQVKAGAVQTIVDSVVQHANQVASGKAPTFTLAPSQVEDNSLKAIQYLTPGLLGYAVSAGAVFGTSLTLVNWRKRRVLRRLRLAPVSIGSVVAARIAVSVVVAFVQTAIFLLVATTPFFGLKLTGNWWLVLPLVLVATIAFMSIGLLTGAIAKTEEAANGINQIIVLPMSFLGGAFIPLDNAPGWLQTVSHALPLRYLVTAAQSVLTKGGGVMDVLPAMGGLLAFAAVFTAISWRFFSWDDA